MDDTDVIVVTASSESGESGKRVKSKAGERFIPIHPELEHIGFLEYVDQRRAAGGSQLFPELTLGADGYFSGPFTRWFGRFLKSVNAKAPRTGFHSFRHSYRDALREADISPERVQVLGGWSSKGVSDAYGGGLKPSTLCREIEKIKYPGLDLSHLLDR